MRALVISAFALTLLISAITVYVALSSSSLDGEPYAVIAIEPPSVTLGAPRGPIQKLKQVIKLEDVTRSPKAPERDSTADLSETTVSREDTPKTPSQIASTPKLGPASTTEDLDNKPSVDDDVQSASSQIARNNRTTETARPISTTETQSDDPFFSAAEPGIGLGVGNLGPLEPASTNE